MRNASFRRFRRLSHGLVRLRERLRRRLLPPVLEPGAMPFFSLVYLGFLAFPWIMGVAAGVALWPTLFSAAAFLPLYFAFYWVRGWRRSAILLVIGAMAIPMLQHNWFASTFLIYSNVLAVFLAWPQMLLVLAASQLMWLLAVSLTELPFGLFLFMGLLTGLLSAAGNWIWVQSMRRHAALRLSQDEVRRLAGLAERERIGRDLHDLLGHTLSVVALKSELAAKLVKRDPDAASREIAEVGQVAREALSQVRSAVTGIRRMLLGVELASARLALDAVQVEFSYRAEPASLPVEVETVLALALREAVTNVVRHADARHCRARVEADGVRVLLRIEDDGVGPGGNEGQGLRGMRERLEALGGRLSITPRPGGGTQVEAMLPLPEPGAEPVASPPLPPPLPDSPRPA
jgi:two-component system sensor histidine kinase DesK